MSNAAVYYLKRGDTLQLAGTVPLPTGTGTWTATCQVSDGGEFTDDVTVTLTPVTGEPHTIEIEATSEATAAWPVGSLSCDVRFVDQATPPLVLHTDTFLIELVQEVTPNG